MSHRPDQLDFDPDRAIAWAEDVLGQRVLNVVELRGGWTSMMWALTDDRGDPAVLRLMDKEPWRTHADGLLQREADTQRQLAGTAVPAPRSLSVDLDGRHAGMPAHLMTWLPGEVELVRRDQSMHERLAQALVGIHTFRPMGGRPREFQSWATPAKRQVPAWSRQPGLWSTAFSILDGDGPAFEGVFLHRDFHLGNVLWNGGRISGIVDWVETSWGPALLDVAHACTYLAMLHGEDAARDFAAVYDRLAAEVPSSAQRRYWNVMDIVGYLPSPRKVVQPWRDQGVDVSESKAEQRLEDHLAAVLIGDDSPRP